jgi:hypothetical protein
MIDPSLHPDAPVSKVTKYARAEVERRFLLAHMPAGSPTRRVRIDDRYIDGTRLRLRTTRQLDGDEGTEVTRKLTQKIPGASGLPGLLTTFYLSAEEHAALVMLPAHTISKVRWSYPPYGVDIFEAPLEGLLIAEVEFVSWHEASAFVPALEYVAEVTADARSAGGRLATSTRADVLRAPRHGSGPRDKWAVSRRPLACRRPRLCPAATS